MTTMLDGVAAISQSQAPHTKHTMSPDPQSAASVKSNSPAETASSAGTKRKRNAEPKFYAVKSGFTPGIYRSWDECLEQVKGFKGAVFQAFPSLHEAQAFTNGATSSEPQNFYGVQNGRRPGVYTDWPSAQAQIMGWKQPKHRKFSTRAEAEAFVRHGQVKDTQGSEGKAAKKAKVVEGSVQGITPGEKNGDTHEPGTGPLPAGAEDGFDPDIKLDGATGKVVYKTEDEKSKTKLQATGAVKGGVLKIYTDGSSLRNGQSGAVAGVGVFFGPDNPKNVSEALRGARQTNQRAELTAILRALDIAPRHRDVQIITDSRYSIDCVTVWYINWRKNNWQTSARKPVENKDLVENILTKIEERNLLKVKTTFEWVKGHNKDPGNEEADRLAVNGARIGAGLEQVEAADEPNGYF